MWIHLENQGISKKKSKLFDSEFKVEITSADKSLFLYLFLKFVSTLEPKLNESYNNNNNNSLNRQRKDSFYEVSSILFWGGIDG